MGVAAVKMPQLGESVTEGTVERWLKKEGDYVKRDEPLVEVVTDKVNAEIPSPFEGTLLKVSVAEGVTIPIGQEIAVIEVAGEADVALPRSQGEVARSAGGATAVAAPPAAPPAEPAAATAERQRLSPAV